MFFLLGWSQDWPTCGRALACILVSARRTLYKMTKLTVLSVFDGISAARQVLQHLAIPVHYFASEVDKDCLHVSATHFPDVEQLGDVTKLDPGVFGGCPVDLLIGGSPCQNLTKANAGDTSGFSGEKSRLFFEFVRLKEYLQPKWWLLENVASMSPDNRRIATQYLGVPPLLLDSASVSPQNRKRLYWTNIPQDKTTRFTPSTAVLGDILEPQVDERHYLSPELESVYSLLAPGQYWNRLPDDHPEKLHILAVRARRTSSGGDTGFWRVWDTAAKSPAVTASGIKQRMTRFVFRDPHTSRMRYPTPPECERLQGLLPGVTDCLPTDSRRYKVIGNSFSVPAVRLLLSPLLTL